MPNTPDYMDLYLREVHGDFYGADYYRAPQDQTESAIIYDDGEDKRTMSVLFVTTFAPRRSLEVGCALGYLVKAMRAQGVEADGIDFSQWCIDSAHPQAKAWVRRGDVLELSRPEKPYDLVLALDVLEHLPPQAVATALRNMAAALAPGGVVFTVVPAYGPNAFGPEIFTISRPTWQEDAKRGVPFSDIPLDDKGRPHLGHLTHATIDWWERAFAGAGLVRLGPVERALHDKYDGVLQFARRSFFVFAKTGIWGRRRLVRRLLGRIAATPGLPRGFWAWEQWGPGGWMHWTTDRAWTPIETRGREALTLHAICNHPGIDRDPVTVRFRIDGGEPHDVVFRDHDWREVRVLLPSALHRPRGRVFARLAG